MKFILTCCLFLAQSSNAQLFTQIPDDESLALSVQIYGMVTIDLQTKKITYAKDYTPDAAARKFWEAISHRAPCETKQ